MFAGVLVSDNFKEQFPETLDANISGITSSTFFVSSYIDDLIERRELNNMEHE